MNIQISKSFKTQIRKTLFSILLFILVYFILLGLTIGVTILFSYIGIWAILNYPNILTIGLGLGLIASGFTILYFLIKFIFASNKIDTNDLIEVTEQDQPELFSLIHELVNEIETDFPKKVYLSHNVNASVFYNSSFWSMFLPVKKNLQIGIGLINSLTRQELKGILAHEFGHFSQRSMKVGSYVYNVNNVIFNMLYNNESLKKMQNSLMNLSGYAAITLGLSSISINGIQKILRVLYEYININYLALSREMEFHADEIAVHVAGSKAMSDGLLRLSFANYAFETAFNFYEGKITENLKPQNIYQDQHTLSLFLASKNKYDIQNGYPLIGLESDAKYNKSKLVIEDQWASHPSTADRVKAINRLNIEKENIDNAAAIGILKNKGDLFQRVHDFLFSQFNHEGQINEITAERFQELYEKDIAKYEFNVLYNEYYNYSNPTVDDFSVIDFNAKVQPIEELFKDDNTELVLELNALINDERTLKSIQNKEIKLKSFDYDGQKYKSKEVDGVLNILSKEIDVKKRLISAINNQIFESFYQMSKTTNKEFELRDAYNKIIELDTEFEEKMQFYDELTQKTSFIYYNLEYADILISFGEIKHLEKRLKEELTELLKVEGITDGLPNDSLEMINHYIHNELVYFSGSSYDDKNLNHLMTAIHQYAYLKSTEYYVHKMNLLNLQVDIYHSYNK